MKPAQALTDDELLTILQQRLERARQQGLTETDRKEAVDYYLCRPRGDELEGRSRVQSADVADMVEATLAQLLPSFTGDTVCSFEADGQNDEQQARLESDAVNKVMMESSRGFVVFYEAIKDALMLRNGIIKVWSETEAWEDNQSYSGLTPDQLAHVRNTAGAVEPHESGEAGRYQVTTSGERTRIRMQAIDPLNFYVDDEADCILLDRARGMYERKVVSRGELVAMDFSPDVVGQLTPYSPGTNVTDNARRPEGVSTWAYGSSGWASELVEIFEGYVRIDRDGNGQEELLRCLFGNNVYLSAEPAGHICYASGTAFIQPHRWQGLSMHDKLKGVQDVKTATLRGFIDNINVASNARLAVNSEIVNIEDALTSRPGGIIRVRGMPGEALMPIPAIELGQSAQSLLSYMDKVRSERGGAQLEMASGEPGLVTSQIGAQNVAQVLTSTELLGAMIARTLAETLIRSTFLLVHTVLRHESTEPMTLRLADQWVSVDPRSWRERETINIKAGLSPGERTRKAANIEKVVQHQMTLLQAGMDGVLVSLPNLYSSILDWASASGIDAVQKYFVDPAGQASSQAQQAKSQQSQQMQQMQQQLAQAEHQLKAQDLQLKKYQADLEDKFNYWKEALHAEIEEAKLVGAATAELQLAEYQGRERAQTGGGGANGAADAG